MKPKRMFRNARNELYEMDYLNKLSASERAWLNQFLREYYQGDFNNDEAPIHPPALHKECRDRDNAARRQITAVSEEARWQAEVRARAAQNKKYKNQYYSPDDYAEYSEQEELDDDY